MPPREKAPEGHEEAPRASGEGWANIDEAWGDVESRRSARIGPPPPPPRPAHSAREHTGPPPPPRTPLAEKHRIVSEETARLVVPHPAPSSADAPPDLSAHGLSSPAGPPEQTSAAVEWEAPEPSTIRRLSRQLGVTGPAQRELPVVPPLERKVARTIMGLGPAELKEQKHLSPFAAPEKPEANMPFPAPFGPSPQGSRGPASAPGAAIATATTAPMPAMDPPGDDPPASGPGPFRSTDALPPTVETVRVGPGSPRVVTPTAGAGRYTPRSPKVPQGPSNVVLATLWAVALLSVGLAVFLYLTR